VLVWMEDVNGHLCFRRDGLLNVLERRDGSLIARALVSVLFQRSPQRPQGLLHLLLEIHVHDSLCAEQKRIRI
jgi:hypothetical protein